jgi:palmitoyltransferase
MNTSDNNEDIMDVIAAVQEGDFDVVKDAIVNKLVSVNCTDTDGCTLLHWAAINNRVEIAAFLIENGLHSVGGGGVLFENPLQWSIRKKYYAMADLIMQKNVCDVAHKSAHGSDALHIACKLGKFFCIVFRMYI